MKNLTEVQPIQIANDALVLCPQTHCVDEGVMVGTLYECPECNQIMCRACLESHEAEGHTTDYDTAREQFSGVA